MAFCHHCCWGSSTIALIACSPAFISISLSLREVNEDMLRRAHTSNFREQVSSLLVNAERAIKKLKEDDAPQHLNTMPRGYLKRSAKQVGRKAARGGSSRRPNLSFYWKEPRELPNLSAVAEDCIDDYEMAHEDMLYEFYEEDCYEETDESRVCDEHINRNSVPVVDHVSTAETPYEGELVANTITTQKDFDGASSVDDGFSLMSGMVSSNGEDAEVDEASYSLCKDDDDSMLSGFSLISVRNMEDSVENKCSDASSIWSMVGTATAIVEANLVPDQVSAEEEDVDVEPAMKNSVKAVDSNETTHRPVQETTKHCAICLEETPVVQLLSKCRHPRACFKCLRIHYVKHAMRDPGNYPLKCFWPGCTRDLHTVQMQQLTQNSGEEMAVFFHNQAEARNLRQEAKQEEQRIALRARLPGTRMNNLKTLQYCPNCLDATPVYPYRPTKTVVCKGCYQKNDIDVMSREDVKCIVEAAGDYLVNCPDCSRLILKDGGCDHMTCVCEHQFSFDRAKYAMDGQDWRCWKSLAC